MPQRQALKPLESTRQYDDRTWTNTVCSANEESAILGRGRDAGVRSVHPKSILLLTVATGGTVRSIGKYPSQQRRRRLVDRSNNISSPAMERYDRVDLIKQNSRSPCFLSSLREFSAAAALPSSSRMPIPLFSSTVTARRHDTWSDGVMIRLPPERTRRRPNSTPGLYRADLIKTVHRCSFTSSAVSKNCFTLGHLPTEATGATSPSDSPRVGCGKFGLLAGHESRSKIRQFRK